MDIRCRKTVCAYNENYACKAKEILVKKNCECAKYEKGNKPPVDKTKWLFADQPPKYGVLKNSETTDIGCNAHCLFNDNGKCVANGITLNELQEKPVCVTFLRE